MKNIQSAKRFIPAIAAFVLVAVGTLIALPNDDTASSAEQRQPTLVLSVDVESGTPATDVAAHTEVKMIEVAARASGALSSLDEVPEGVLVATHVAGQQLLASSFAGNVVEGLGKGFVAVSVRLDAQRWVGPVMATGKIVDIYDIVEASADPIVRGAVVLSAPAPEEFDPRAEAIVSLGVPESTLSRVLVAANENRVWLVGA